MYDLRLRWPRWILSRVLGTSSGVGSGEGYMAPWIVLLSAS